MQIRAGDDIAPAHGSWPLELFTYIIQTCPSLSCLRSCGDWYRGWLQMLLPSNPAECLNRAGRRADHASFPNVLTENGSSRNQTRHLLHVVLGPQAVSCSSMEQTCLLLPCLVCGEQQTLGRGGDGHRYRFVIIKLQEPGVRAPARSWGILVCPIPRMFPANFHCPFLPLPPAHKGWVIKSSVFIPQYR